MADAPRLRHIVFRSSEVRTANTCDAMNSAGIALFTVTAILSVSYAHAQHAPCHAASPDFQLCSRSNLQHLIPQLAYGLRNIGADPIEPLRGLPSIRHSSPSGLNTQLDDVVISGLSTAIVKDIHVDLASNSIRIVSTFPAEIVATGVQSTDAEIMGIPLKGTGPFKISIDQPTLGLTLSGAPSPGPDGQTYLRLSSVDAKLQPGPASIQVTGLFSQFPPLERAANAFANSVADVAVAELRPTLEKWLSGIVLERARAVLDRLPYDTIFPGRTTAAAVLYRAFPALPQPLYYK